MNQSSLRPSSARWLAGAFAAAMAQVCLPGIASAQPDARPAGVTTGPLRAAALTPTPARPRDGLMSRDSAWWVPLSSTLLPGLGQVRLGQDRFVAYAAVEVYSIVGYLAGEAAVRRERHRYLALARDVARAFVPGNNAIGDWDYYEAMEKHIESGVFNRAPGTGTLTPESDLTTFNGALWLKARQLSNWPDPNVEPDHASVPYQTAIAFYAARAVGPEFRWSWRNSQLEWDVYRQSIRRKNEASRDARHFLALVAFNHVLSTIDAFVTLRLRGGAGAGGSGYWLTATVPLP